MPTPTTLEKRIDAVRRFNRFHTRQVGALDERHLRNPFSLSQARVIYEIANRARPTASVIAEGLFLDRGYLSRVLTGFARRGLVKKSRSSADRRESVLALTPKGREMFARLNASASADVGSMLAKIPSESQATLVQAMNIIETVLDPTVVPGEPFTFREHGPGDIGWVIERHGLIYSEEYGWDSRFEALVAEIGAKFLRDFDSARERCWIAERQGVRIGCVFLVSRSKTVSQLRLLLVDPSVRGLGIGNRLVQECIDFARASGYRKMQLWTNDVLVSARKIYQAAGFRLLEEKTHSTFGKPLTSQTWEMTL